MAASKVCKYSMGPGSLVAVSPALLSEMLSCFSTVVTPPALPLFRQFLICVSIGLTRLLLSNFIIYCLPMIPSLRPCSLGLAVMLPPVGCLLLIVIPPLALPSCFQTSFSVFLYTPAHTCPTTRFSFSLALLFLVVVATIIVFFAIHAPQVPVFFVIRALEVPVFCVTLFLPITSSIVQFFGLFVSFLLGFF